MVETFARPSKRPKYRNSSDSLDKILRHCLRQPPAFTSNLGAGHFGLTMSKEGFSGIKAGGGHLCIKTKPHCIVRTLVLMPCPPGEPCHTPSRSAVLVLWQAPMVLCLGLCGGDASEQG